MIAGLPLEYACARAWARLAQRPDERLWQQLRAAHSVPALVEALRSSRAAATVSGVALTADPDAIELAFRQQMRTRIDEVARWSPEEWQAAVRHTRLLVDLPAVIRLASDEPPPRWLASDPVLARYADDRPSARREELRKGPLNEFIAVLDAPEPTALSVVLRDRLAPAIHRVLAAWERGWRLRWPRTSTEDARPLEDLVRVLRSHLARFVLLSTADTSTARHALGERLTTLARRAALQPATLFAYLALFALDLERLRAEFVRRARPLDARATSP